MLAVQTSAPAVEPVTLVEAKAHCRVDTSDDDTLITALIVSARLEAEAKTGRKFVTQSWRATFDDFSAMNLADLSPVVTIDLIKYDDTAGAEQTLAVGQYRLIASSPATIIAAYGVTFPTPRNQQGAVRVTVTVGYGNAAAVPQPIKQWMLMRVASMYAHREDLETLTRGQNVVVSFADSLLDAFRVIL